MHEKRSTDCEKLLHLIISKIWEKLKRQACMNRNQGQRIGIVDSKYAWKGLPNYRKTTTLCHFQSCKHMNRQTGNKREAWSKVNRKYPWKPSRQKQGVHTRLLTGIKEGSALHVDLRQRRGEIFPGLRPAALQLHLTPVGSPKWAHDAVQRRLAQAAGWVAVRDAAWWVQGSLGELAAAATQPMSHAVGALVGGRDFGTQWRLHPRVTCTDDQDVRQQIRWWKSFRNSGGSNLY